VGCFCEGMLAQGGLVCLALALKQFQLFLSSHSTLWPLYARSSTWAYGIDGFYKRYNRIAFVE